MNNLLNLTSKIETKAFEQAVKALEKLIYESSEEGSLSVLKLDFPQFKVFMFAQVMLLHRLIATLAAYMPEDIKLEIDKTLDMDLKELLREVLSYDKEGR